MGDANDPQIDVECQYQNSRLLKNKLTGNIELKIINAGKNPFTVVITDNAYKNNPVTKKLAPSGEETIVLDLKKSSGWYDFSVAVKENSAFAKRYAGRVETGKETISDPFMGRTI
jgi:phospholipase C